MPRFSIRQLLIATAVVAVGCVALLNASPIWSASLVCASALILAGSVLLAVFRDSERRAYWIGFAFCGWLYVLLCFSGILAESRNPFGWGRIATGRLASALYDRIHFRNQVQPMPSVAEMPMPGTFEWATMPAVAGYDRRTEFLFVAHSLWALLFAVLGGWFACWLYATRAARQKA